MTAPVNVTVTGAAGQIGYALLFRIASGAMLGRRRPGAPAAARDAPAALKAAEGTAMELDDCAFPLLAGVDIFDDADRRVRRRERGAAGRRASRAAPGMERGDLLAANGGIFGPQGAAINAGAADDVRVLVVGNPANTNALIASAHAPDVPAGALHRDDAARPQPRARAARRRRRACPVRDVDNVIIWGNHSAKQYPDIAHAMIGGTPALGGHRRRRVGERTTFVPTVAKRGAAIIEARGASSAASAANAAIEHVRDWVSARRRARGPRWRCRPTARTACPRASCSRFPVRVARAARGRSSRASRSTTTHAARSTSRSRRLAEERDAVTMLGLI